MHPNYTKAFLCLEGVSIKKWFRQTLLLKFSSTPNRQNRLSPAAGLKENGFAITVYKRFPYWENR